MSRKSWAYRTLQIYFNSTKLWKEKVGLLCSNIAIDLSGGWGDLRGYFSVRLIFRRFLDLANSTETSRSQSKSSNLRYLYDVKCLSIMCWTGYLMW